MSHARSNADPSGAIWFIFLVIMALACLVTWS